MRRAGWVACAALACSDKTDPAVSINETADTSAATDTETSYVCELYDPTWEGVQALFEARCDDCHRTESQAGRFDLRAEVEADLASGLGALVVPGDPETSELWRVISGSGIPRMPPTSSLLHPSETCHVRDWILAGASLTRKPGIEIDRPRN